MTHTMLDHVFLSVSPKTYAEFLARLNAPSKPNERLKRHRPHLGTPIAIAILANQRDDAYGSAGLPTNSAKPHGCIKTF